MGVRDVAVSGHRNLIVHELEDVCDSGTGRVLTGSWLWDSSVLLSRWMAATRADDIRGKSVIELGAGTGLAGMTAAVLGAGRVVLTDVKALLPGMERNVEANGLGERVEVRELVWGKEKTEEEEEEELFDIVLMSDVFLEAEAMEDLGKTLKRACGIESKVWCASEVRQWTYDCFRKLATQGFRLVELPTPLALSDFCSSLDTFSIFHLIPPIAHCQVDPDCLVGHYIVFEGLADTEANRL